MRSASICGCDDVSRPLMSISKRQTKAAKTVLFEESDPAKFVFNLVRGVVLLSKSLSDGRRQVVGIALPGDFMGLALTELHSFTATALSEVEVCRIERETLSALLDENPRLVRRVYATSASELTAAQDHMILLGLLDGGREGGEFPLPAPRPLGARTLRLVAGRPAAHATGHRRLSRPDARDRQPSIFKLAKQKIIVVVPDGVRILDLDALGAMTVH